MTRCAVFNCKSNSAISKNIKFFRFPKEKKLCKKWVTACHRKDKFKTTGARVCSQHFPVLTHTMMCQLMGQRDQKSCNCTLPEGAVPTLKIPNRASPAHKTETQERREGRQKAKEKAKVLQELLESSPATQLDPGYI